MNTEYKSTCNISWMPRTSPVHTIVQTRSLWVSQLGSPCRGLVGISSPGRNCKIWTNTRDHICNRKYFNGILINLYSNLYPEDASSQASFRNSEYIFLLKFSLRKNDQNLNRVFISWLWPMPIFFLSLRHREWYLVYCSWENPAREEIIWYCK